MFSLFASRSFLSRGLFLNESADFHAGPAFHDIGCPSGADRPLGGKEGDCSGARTESHGARHRSFETSSTRPNVREREKRGGALRLRALRAAVEALSPWRIIAPTIPRPYGREHNL